MTCGIEIAKQHARILQRRAREGDVETVRELARLPGLGDLEPATVREAVQRKHCLALVARKLGFRGWANAAVVLGGESSDDFGDMLYPGTDAGYWNVWSANLEEARSIRAEHGGYLLAYRNQFLITEESLVAAVGLDPEHADWALIGRDWTHDEGRAVRARFYASLVERKLGVPA